VARSSLCSPSSCSRWRGPINSIRYAHPTESVPGFTSIGLPRPWSGEWNRGRDDLRPMRGHNIPPLPEAPSARDDHSGFGLIFRSATHSCSAIPFLTPPIFRRCYSPNNAQPHTSQPARLRQRCPRQCGPHRRPAHNFLLAHAHTTPALETVLKSAPNPAKMWAG
jgi:hypothetical protein